MLSRSFLLAWAGLFLMGCTHLVYYPSRVKYVNDQKLTHRPEEVHFLSEDRNDLVGWYFAAKKEPKAVFLFFHGNGQNLSSHFSALYWILDQGYDFFIFDYPGYGISEGEPTPKNTVQSGKAALHWLRVRKPNTPIVVFGQSLGGVIASRTLIEMKNEIPVCLLVLDSTLESYQRAASDVLRSNWWTWAISPLAYILMNDEWTGKDRLGEISVPALVLHSKQDPVVKFKRGAEVFRDLREPKTFWETAGVGHGDAFVGADKARTRPLLFEQVNKYCANNAKP